MKNVIGDWNVEDFISAKPIPFGGLKVFLGVSGVILYIWFVFDLHYRLAGIDVFWSIFLVFVLVFGACWVVGVSRLRFALTWIVRYLDRNVMGNAAVFRLNADGVAADFFIFPSFVDYRGYFHDDQGISVVIVCELGGWRRRKCELVHGESSWSAWWTVKEVYSEDEVLFSFTDSVGVTRTMWPAMGIDILTRYFVRTGMTFPSFTWGDVRDSIGITSLCVAPLNRREAEVIRRRSAFRVVGGD